jgi:hypothetical protein
LLIEEAVTITNENGQRVLIAGYSGQVDTAHLLWLGAKLVLALYLIASALAKFDSCRMTRVEVGARLVLAVLVLWKTDTLMWVGIVGAVLVLCWHHLIAARRVVQPVT